MGTNPFNLTLRFVLEMSALVAVALAGWQLFDGVGRWLAVVGLPLAMAAMWGTFGVDNDPSRGGSPPVRVPGAIRLTLEAVFFGLGVAAVWLIGAETLAVVFGALVVFHYAISWDRIGWLLEAGDRR